jgi:hypothetical protein
MYSELISYVFFTGRNVWFICNKEVNYMTWYSRTHFHDIKYSNVSVYEKSLTCCRLYEMHK